MAQKVSLESFPDAIINTLKEYQELVEEDLLEVAKKIAKEGTLKLKRTSPKGTSKKPYAKGWAVKYIKQTKYKFRFVVYNRTKPGLTHLLEHGHQLWQGGRAKSFPHIEKVEKWCNKEFEKELKKRLSN